MGYQYQEIDINKWSEFTKEGVGVFGSKDFLLATAEVYSFKLLFCLVTFKDTPALAISLFTKGSRVVSPNHYYYQFVWQGSEPTGSWIQQDAWDILLQNLKAKYTRINLRLPVSVTDGRPFTWNNFSIHIKYTYLKNLNDLTYHHNIQRILKKKQQQYSFKNNCDWDENWVLHQRDLEKFGIRKVYVDLYLKYFKTLKEEGLIRVFNAYDKDVFLTSIVAIVDKTAKTAYLPLIGTADGHYNAGLPSLLYDYALTELKDTGIERVDLCGANIQSIAKYKSKFLPDLVQFFEVSYSKKSVVIKTKFFEIKEIIGRILFAVIILCGAISF